ncbi:MAG: tyrosine--tRNA ligase [Myxococcota bacterium]|nr:tyrosine--tRNA ligase [Myxococcota bacterium]
MTSDAIAAEVEKQLVAMREGAVDLFGEDELRERLGAALREHRPLRVKLGMDPSAPDLHLGHTVVLLKLRRMQQLGHVPIFLVGDFTAAIGDPSGKKKTRPALSREEVAKNAATYVEQVAKILDVEGAEVRFNSEWMDAMSPADMVRLCSKYTVARLLERDDFAKRYRAGESISVHEFLYPFVQAYDSVALHADVELGGTDQTFNLLMAREIQRDYGQPAQAVITHPLLVGTDGNDKMSKSLGNTVGISDAPEEMYGRTLSISDPLMLEWYDLLSGGEWEDLREERARLAEGAGDPLAFKHELARRIVARFHDEEAARAAAEHFQRVVKRREVPEDLEEQHVAPGESGDRGLLELLEELGLVASRGEARRLVTQGAVSVDGEGVSDPRLRLSPGSFLLKVGKRRFARVRIG